MFSWLTKILFGPGKPTVACDQPPQPVQVVVEEGACCAGLLHALKKIVCCPGCRHPLDGVLSGGRNPPEGKNYVSCLRCGQVNVLTIDACGGEPELRPTTDEELSRVKRGIGAAWDGVEEQQRAWRLSEQRRITWPRMKHRSWN